MSHHFCPVCETELDIGALATRVLSTPRGERKWARCPACRSFFAIGPYDPEQEAGHTSTRPWGMAESGIALNDEKEPMFEAILGLLEKFAAKGTTLLDVGCSYGGFLMRAKDRGYIVRGMDIVPEAVEYVRSRGISCDRAASVADLGIPVNSVGIATVLDCNYYWPDQRKELRAVRSVLRPGGLLAMRVVDTSWAVQIGIWLSMLFPRAGHSLSEKAVYDHRVSIPVRSLLRVVEQEGFEIVHTSARAAMPFRHNGIKIKIAYAVGGFAWLLARYNLAPGFVFLARKR